MLRCITILLSFALVVGGLEAGTHFEPLADGDTSHELHAGFHGDGNATDTDGDPSDHFCHCAAHSPSLTVAFDWLLAPTPQRAASTVPTLHPDGKLQPPLRPPNLA